MATTKGLSLIFEIPNFANAYLLKSPSFKVIACFVWNSEQFTGLEVENTPPPPGMNRVKVNSSQQTCQLGFDFEVTFLFSTSESYYFVTL